MPHNQTLTDKTGEGGQVRKRSILLDGRRTSITIPDPLWREFKCIAARRGAQLQELFYEIDLRRGNAKLSLAVREFVSTQIALGQIHASSPPIAADDFDAKEMLVYGGGE